VQLRLCHPLPDRLGAGHAIHTSRNISAASVPLRRNILEDEQSNSFAVFMLTNVETLA
jgi:hypothetical protein